MRYFLWRFLFFILTVVLGLGAIFCYNSYQVAYRKPQLDQDTWLVGDSQVMVGINPQQFPDAVNIAQQAEPFFVTFYKLKALLAYQQPKRIILGFSPHHFSDFNDTKFRQPKLAKALFKRVYSIMSLQDFQSFETNQQELWWTYFQRWCVIPKARHYDYIGHYEARPKQLNLSNPKIAVERHFYKGTEPSGISLQMIHYLEKIVELTSSKQIELILVSLPVHEAYRKAIPPQFKAIFEEKKQEFKQRKIMVLDFSDYLLKDDYFSDHDHLNQEGASFFTTLLSQNLH